MKQLRFRVTDCSYDDLIRAARKCGFVVKQGGKHAKIETADGKFITTVPRHNPVKRETAKGIVESYNQFGAKISY
ncbi:MAG: type II toxin-antitoxin system HicA family toxin [Minisyncoccia bacterium]